MSDPPAPRGDQRSPGTSEIACPYFKSPQSAAVGTGDPASPSRPIYTTVAASHGYRVFRPNRCDSREKCGLASRTEQVLVFNDLWPLAKSDVRTEW